MTQQARLTALEALRQDYPAWMIGVIGSRWIAFWDNGVSQQIHVERKDPISLRDRLEFFEARMRTTTP